MINNAPTKNLADNTPDEESGEWVITLYEPYCLPAEPPYHVPPEPDESVGWVLTIMSRIACLLHVSKATKPK